MINRRIGWFYHNNIGVVLSNTNRVGAISFIKAVRKFFSPKFKLPGCRVYFYTKPDNTPEKTKKIKGYVKTKEYLILKPCSKKKYSRLKTMFSGVLGVLMLVKAGKTYIKEMTSLQRIHASISER